MSLVLNQRPDFDKPGYYNLEGQMIVKKNIIEVGGVYVLQKNMLAYFKIESKNGVSLVYRITPQTDGFQCYISMNDPNTKMDFKVISRVEFIHKLDWFFKLEVNLKFSLIFMRFPLSFVDMDISTTKFKIGFFFFLNMYPKNPNHSIHCLKSIWKTLYITILYTIFHKVCVQS